MDINKSYWVINVLEHKWLIIDIKFIEGISEMQV